MIFIFKNQSIDGGSSTVAPNTTTFNFKSNIYNLVVIRLSRNYCFTRLMPKEKIIKVTAPHTKKLVINGVTVPL